jgi:hypothetical protein
MYLVGAVADKSEVGPAGVRLDEASRREAGGPGEEEERIARGETVTFLVGE